MADSLQKRLNKKWEMRQKHGQKYNKIIAKGGKNVTKKRKKRLLESEVVVNIHLNRDDLVSLDSYILRQKSS